MGLLFATGTGLTRNTTLPPFTGDFTCSLWVKVTNLPGGADYLSPYAQGNLSGAYNQYAAIFSDVGTSDLTAYVANGGAGVACSSVVTAALNVWTYLSYRRSGTTQTYLVNGVARGSTTLDLTANAITEELIGVDGFSVGTFAAAYYRSWTRALSDVEILSEMVSAGPVSLTNLFTSTPLPNISDLTDHSGNGHTWTAVGAIATTDDPNLSSTTSTPVTYPIRWLRRSPHLSEEAGRMFHAQLQIDAQVGIGLTSGQGSDPQVMLRYSNDGGQTWGPERWATLGALGKYRTRVIFRRLGMARDRVYELSGSDPVPVALCDAYLDVEQGLS